MVSMGKLHDQQPKQPDKTRKSNTLTEPFILNIPPIVKGRDAFVKARDALPQIAPRP
jgi:hypothetical protein